MFVSSVSRNLGICLMLGAAVLTGLPNKSHAVGNLDAALLREGATIVQKIRRAGIRAVGVLQFGAKVEGAKSTRGKKNQVRTRMGPINKFMAEYVENALVQSNDLLRPLTILENPSEVARKRMKKPNLATAVARKQFFRARYPVYGSRTRRVVPQAFVTGQVTLSKSYVKTSVILALIKPDGRISFLHKFTVPTDQFVLREMGIGFSYSKKYPKLRKFGSRALYSRSPLSSRNAEFPDMRDLGVGSSTSTIPKGGSAVEVKILYDGTEEELKVDDSLVTTETTEDDRGRLRENYRISDPHEGTKIEIHVKNTSTDIIGIVVMVAGKSTLHATERFEDAKRWILDPDETIKLKGFYDVEGETNKYRPFKVADAITTENLFAAADEEEARRLSTITVDVFRPGTKSAAFRYDNKRSLRRPASLRGKRGVSQTALSRALSRRQPMTKRGVIIQGDDLKDAKLKDSTLGDVAPVDHIVITYIDPAGSSGGGGGALGDP